jgi:hypothetical protein
LTFATKGRRLCAARTYYLDATETLQRYYAVQQGGPSFGLHRALFQDILPTSASPVSVEGIGTTWQRRCVPIPNRL